MNAAEPPHESQWPEHQRAGNMANMKTTLDLPPELMRAIKIRAVETNRKLKDTVAALLKRGLAGEEAMPTKVRRRVRLPLVRCAHRAKPGEEISPERAAELLLAEDSGASRAAVVR